MACAQTCMDQLFPAWLYTGHLSWCQPMDHLLTRQPSGSQSVRVTSDTGAHLTEADLYQYQIYFEWSLLTNFCLKSFRCCTQYQGIDWPYELKDSVRAAWCHPATCVVHDLLHGSMKMSISKFQHLILDKCLFWDRYFLIAERILTFCVNYHD